jgi:hypothetical protein
MRFSLKTLLAAFALVGATCAALLYPTRLFATVFFSCALFLLLLGIIAACGKRGRAQFYWIGFTVLGSGYFLCSIFEVHPYARAQGERQTWSEPRLLTSELLLAVNDWLTDVRPAAKNRMPGTTTVRNALQMYFVGQGTAGHTLMIGHSVFTIVMALVGGAISSWIYRENEAVKPDST